MTHERQKPQQKYNTMEHLNKMEDMVEDAKEEANKFYNKKNKSAGIRLRKIMQELKTLAQEIRVDVQGNK